MSQRERNALPPSAFAYIDSGGERRLPIHDAQHARNALARFSRIEFENDAARERARKRILTAAARHGIMPLGFITSQIAPRQPVAALPSGQVTFLLTDLEGSTELVQQLGDEYASLIQEVRELHRVALRSGGGREVDARADEFFAVFADAASAAASALEIQLRLAEHGWPRPVRVRIGVHTGRPTLASVGYVGVDVHVAARVANAAHGGQILATSEARLAVDGASAGVYAFRSLGAFRLRGLRSPMELFELGSSGVVDVYPPPRGAVPEP